MKPLVLDGSAIIGVLLRDDNSAYTEKLMREIESRSSLYVPAHWWLETANGLLMATRRGRIAESEMGGVFDFLHGLSVVTDGETDLRCTDSTYALAQQYSLTMYDAAYLELALRRRSTLATLDRALARAAKTAGVELLADL